MSLKIMDESFETFEDIKQALHKENYESSKLILGFDFNNRNQIDNHQINRNNPEFKNPYQQCLEFIKHSLTFLDDDNAVRYK